MAQGSDERGARGSAFLEAILAIPIVFLFLVVTYELTVSLRVAQISAFMSNEAAKLVHRECGFYPKDELRECLDVVRTRFETHTLNYLHLTQVYDVHVIVSVFTPTDVVVSQAVVAVPALRREDIGQDFIVRAGRVTVAEFNSSRSGMFRTLFPFQSNYRSVTVI